MLLWLIKERRVLAIPIPAINIALIEIRDSSKKETNEKMSELGFQKKKEVKRESTSDEFWFKEN